MTTFDVRATDLRALNTMTKYPSIPTYHPLDAKHGGLLEEGTAFSTAGVEGTVIGTEKVDGTNARIIVLPDDTWLLGSREELLHAKGDLIANPALGIVDALRPIADALDIGTTAVLTFYLEVYGGRVGGAAKQYSTTGEVGWRLFDVAAVPDHDEVLTWPLAKISAWRDAGGPSFSGEDELRTVASHERLELTPRLFELPAGDLPTGIPQMREFLGAHLPHTRVALGDATPGRSEGIVLRTRDRSVIAKARFQDYDRTLKRRG